MRAIVEVLMRCHGNIIEGHICFLGWPREEFKVEWHLAGPWMNWSMIGA